jgi:CelD/BcsL family acetyltransferase involved in cellulose biosynthesis
MIAQGVRTYDFLGGEPGYKAKWGAQSGQYVDLRFARPFSAGATFLQSQHLAVQSKSWLRRNLPAAAWNALRQINSVKARMRGEKQPVNSAHAGTDQDTAADGK